MPIPHARQSTPRSGLAQQETRSWRGMANMEEYAIPRGRRTHLTRRSPGRKVRGQRSAQTRGGPKAGSVKGKRRSLEHAPIGHRRPSMPSSNGRGSDCSNPRPSRDSMVRSRCIPDTRLFRTGSSRLGRRCGRQVAATQGSDDLRLCCQFQRLELIDMFLHAVVAHPVGQVADDALLYIVI